MGQRNENSVRELRKEAKKKKKEYRKELTDADGKEEEEVLMQKIQKCTHIEEFTRWQLGKDLHVDL